MNKNKLIIIVFSTLFLFVFSGCSNHNWKGQSVNWSCQMTYASDTKNLNYIIRYIGKEKTISNFTYKFSGNIITASGGNDKKLTPPYQITFDTPAKNYESEDDTVKLKINWNGKEETIEMNSK